MPFHKGFRKNIDLKRTIQDFPPFFSKKKPPEKRKWYSRFPETHHEKIFTKIA